MTSINGYTAWMNQEVAPACDDCPLFAAQAEMTVSRDFSGEYDYETPLTVGDTLRLESVMTKDVDGGHRVVNGIDCPGPARTVLGLGRKVCRGKLTLMLPNA